MGAWDEIEYTVIIWRMMFPSNTTAITYAQAGVLPLNRHLTLRILSRLPSADTRNRESVYNRQFAR